MQAHQPHRGDESWEKSWQDNDMIRDGGNSDVVPSILIGLISFNEKSKWMRLSDIAHDSKDRETFKLHLI